MIFDGTGRLMGKSWGSGWVGFMGEILLLRWLWCYIFLSFVKTKWDGRGRWGFQSIVKDTRLQKSCKKPKNAKSIAHRAPGNVNI
jgi:hypothetical protein